MVEQKETPTRVVADQASTEAFLIQQGITFNTVTHEGVTGIPDMLEKVAFEGQYKNAKFAKNLFMWDTKAKTNRKMWLICAAHDTNMNMKAVEKALGAGNGKLRGAGTDFMERILGVLPGAVNLFSILNDTANEINLVMDKRLMDDFELVAFHPMINTATTAFRREDIQKIIDASKHEVQVMDFVEMGGSTGTVEQKPKVQKSTEEKKQPVPVKKAEKVEGIHNEGIQYTKEKNFSEWYQQVITKSDLIEYYDISGCYILRPRSYFIWEQIQGFMDSRFKALGVQNAYFPMFVTEAALNKEKEHVEGFSPEVAWVTKSGQSEMKEPIAIRPTSETIMYPAYAKWIHSHRDLPMLINQWTNVVRWEFKHPTPFIRTREFLWQEGHTAHATKIDADSFVREILNIYAKTYEELLAVPVIKGRKSDDERFPGADNTETVELYVPVSGRGIQGATSHMLGNNFAKMFEINYQDEEGVSRMVWQASWGFSTRSIGAMIMIHSDNLGLVLPPKAAQTQVVILAIVNKGDDKNLIFAKCDQVGKTLRESGVRVTVDLNERQTFKYKCMLWEQRGTPIRLEMGKRDFDKNEFKCKVRHLGKESKGEQLAIDGLADNLQNKFVEIHDQMFQKAVDARAAHMSTVTTKEDFLKKLNNKDICLATFCDRAECEIQVKNWSKEESIKQMENANEGEVNLTGSAKTLCIPFEYGKQDFTDSNETCLFCGKPAKVTALWGRSY